jgi:hypothetical protein
MLSSTFRQDFAILLAAYLQHSPQRVITVGVDKAYERKADAHLWLSSGSTPSPDSSTGARRKPDCWPGRLAAPDRPRGGNIARPCMRVDQADRSVSGINIGRVAS